MKRNVYVAHLREDKWVHGHSLDEHSACLDVRWSGLHIPTQDKAFMHPPKIKPSFTQDKAFMHISKAHYVHKGTQKKPSICTSIISIHLYQNLLSGLQKKTYVKSFKIYGFFLIKISRIQTKKAHIRPLRGAWAHHKGLFKAHPFGNWAFFGHTHAYADLYLDEYMYVWGPF